MTLARPTKLFFAPLMMGNNLQEDVQVFRGGKRSYWGILALYEVLMH